MAVEFRHGILGTLADGKGDGVHCGGAVLSSLVGDLIGVSLQGLQVAGSHHLRHCGADIEIAQAVVLIAQLIDLLNGHRIVDLGHDEKYQDFHIQHIVNEAQSLHIHHLIIIIPISREKSSTDAAPIA